MSKVYGQFHGGGSYAVSMPGEDMEEFADEREARLTFKERYYGHDHSFPCVDDQASMLLYFGGPDQDYPDRILRTRNGKVVSEPC